MSKEGDKPKSTRQAWDDAAEEDAKEAGVSPAVAKALLAMNPALRAQGLDTKKVVRQSQDLAAGKGTADAKSAAKVDPSAGIYAVLAQLEAEFKRKEHELQSQLALIEVERKKNANDARDRLTQWLIKNDPDILSPVSQGALKDHAPVIAAFGFKTADYIATYRKKKT
ncbi:MAG: hypothetical protein IT381_02240 [Deltaproteobacteria bacterium]|nr:hypothetical protein [Deltaproteobacteria bacterium]